MDWFFFCKRAIGIMAQPLPVIFTLFLLGLALYRFTARRRAALTCVILAVVVLFAVTFPPLVRWQASLLESRYLPLPANASLSPAPSAIVVLGNGVAHPDDRNLPALTRLNDAARARLTEGVRLCRLFPEAGLITTGYGMGLENCADAMAAAAVELGVEPTRVRGLAAALDTGHEAVLAREAVGDGVIILVTSAAHMPRALQHFRRSGLPVVAAPCDYIAPVSSEVGSVVNRYRWRPRGGSLADSEELWHEYLGLLYYRWFQRNGGEGE